MLGTRTGSRRREVQVLVGAQRLDQVDGDLEGQGADAGVPVEQRRVLEMFGTDAGDQVLDLRMLVQSVLGVLRQRDLPKGSLTPTSVNVAEKKFMAGEPMKPATNRLAGRS